MRTHFFAVAVVLMMVVCMPPVLADDGVKQGIIQNGKGNTAYQVGDDAFIHVDKAFVKEDINAPTSVHNTVTYEAPDQGPYTMSLSIGDAMYTRVVKAGKFAVIEIPSNATACGFMSGSPIFAYTISSDYYGKMRTTESAPTYNDIFDRVEHQAVPFESWIPYLTTKNTIGIPTEAKYFVIDTRNEFAANTQVDIVFIDSSGNYLPVDDTQFASKDPLY